MQTIAGMREYINEYVRSKTIEQVGIEILKGYFGIPFEYDLHKEYYINRVPMTEAEAKSYVESFFQDLDTPAIVDLYPRIAI
jgi:hypothetical protein